MAKKALIQKQQRKPKFKVRGVHPLPPVWPGARGVPASSGSAASVFREHGARGRGPRRDEGVVVRGGALTMTDPVADMLTRIRNANIAFHDDVVMPSSKLKDALAKILVQRGLHRRLRASRTTPSVPAAPARSR